MRQPRWKSYPSTPRNAVHMAPWIAPAHPDAYGIPIGIDLRTRKLVVWDPWYLMLAGITMSTCYEIYGQVWGGKSSQEKIVTERMLGRFSRDDIPFPYISVEKGDAETTSEDEELVDQHGRIVKTRCQLASSKSEVGRSEIEPLIKHYGGKMLYYRDMPPINLYDPYFGTRPVELLDTAVNLAESGADGHLLGNDNFKALALAVGLEIMLGEGRKDIKEQDKRRGLNTTVHAGIVRTLTKQDAIDFYRRGNNQVLIDLKDELQHRPDLRERLNVDLFPPVLDEHKFEDDAAMVSNQLDRIHGKDFGNIFGGRASYKEIMRGRLVGKEWGGTPDRARAVMQAMEWKALRVASEPFGDTTAVPHVRQGDEGAKSMELPIHVRQRADYVRTSRQHKTADVQAAQYYSQVTGIGDEGSELRRLAEDIQKGIAGRFVYQLHPDDTYAEKLAAQGVTELDIVQMQGLPKGHCAVLIPGRKPVFMAWLPTSIEWPHIQTAGSLTAQTAAPPIPSELIATQHAEQYGVTLLGTEE